MIMKTKFTDTFRIKLETCIRFLQASVTSVIKTFGIEVAQGHQDQLFTDMVSLLWKIKDDDTVIHGLPADKEWKVFSTILTVEMNKLNEMIQNLQYSALPQVMMLTKYELYIVETSARICDMLNAEFSLLEKHA
jgi:hypothetical protein